MKIHIVQKDDTLAKIAEQYGVDFEALVRLNPQLSNPNMIMPGMKLKIPTETKQVRQKEESKRNKQKEALDIGVPAERPMANLPADDIQRQPNTIYGFRPIEEQTRTQAAQPMEKNKLSREGDGKIQESSKRNIKQTRKERQQRKDAAEEKQSPAHDFYARRPLQNPPFEYPTGRRPMIYPRCCHCYRPMYKDPNSRQAFTDPKNEEAMQQHVNPVKRF